MKKSYKGLLVLAATAMSFISVQTVCAETVSGTIVDISTRPSVVAVDNEINGEITDVYGVRVNYLDNQYNIALSENDYVSFEVSPFECKTGETILKAYSITVGEITVEW